MGGQRETGNLIGMALPMLLVAFSIILLRTGVICASESSSNPAAEGAFICISAFIHLMMVLRWSFSSTKRAISSKISKKSVMCPCLQSAAASSSFFFFVLNMTNQF